MPKGSLRYRLSIYRHFGRSKVSFITRVAIISLLTGLIVASLSLGYQLLVDHVRPAATSHFATIHQNVSLNWSESTGSSWFSNHQRAQASTLSTVLGYLVEVTLAAAVFASLFVLLAHFTRPLLWQDHLRPSRRRLLAPLLALAALALTVVVEAVPPVLARYLQPHLGMHEVPFAYYLVLDLLQCILLYVVVQCLLLYLPLNRPLAPNACNFCRYDLTGSSPASGSPLICPECGSLQPDPTLISTLRARAARRAHRRTIQLIILSTLFILVGVPLFISILTRHADPIVSRIMKVRYGDYPGATLMVRPGSPLRIHTHMGTVEFNFEVPNPVDGQSEVITTWTYNGQTHQISSLELLAKQQAFDRANEELIAAGRPTNRGTILDQHPIIPGHVYISRPYYVEKASVVRLFIDALRPFKVDEY